VFWAWVAVRAVVPLNTFFAMPPNEVVGAGTQILLVILINSSFRK